MKEDLLDTLRLELRCGCMSHAVQAQLRMEHYGYELRKALASQGLDIDENTLYPLLRRLDSQGLLESTWREEHKRQKRFYHLSASGEIVLADLLLEWNALGASLNRIIDTASLSQGAH